MTSETYLDLTFDRTSKSGKRPIRPKLLKLTDVTIPHRNRKKTKVKPKDRSVSSVRDRIYDDPAYTDDISHLANPLRRSSCSGKSDSKALAASTSLGGSSSLGKRSKLTKEFLQYAKQGKMRGGLVSGVGGGDLTSSSDEEQHRSETTKTGSMGRRGRSLERSLAEKSEKVREKRERTSTKQKRNLSLDSNQQSQEAAIAASKKLIELELRSAERAAAGQRGKERKAQAAAPLSKQYSDGANELAWSDRLPPDHDELYSVRSSSKDSGANVSTKMQIGRRLLKGEIGIKSFNYYLLKEGLKSSKKFVEKQRNSLTGSSKKLHSRSEENIYEEIFFKEAPASDEENQNPAAIIQQQSHATQHPQHGTMGSVTGTPISQCSEDAIYPDCELCMQQCTKENCEYCYASGEVQGGQRGGGTARQYAATGGPAQPHPQHQKPQYDSMSRHVTETRSTAAAFINQVHSTTSVVTTTGTVQRSDNNNSNNSVPPTAHILEFQSYNPNNPGVYKIETTPVAITGEYNPILQFQQQSSSPSTTTTTTTPSEQQQQFLHHHQQHQQHQQQHKTLAHGYVVQAGGVPLAGNQYQSGVLSMPGRHRASQRTGMPPSGNGQHFIVSYNGMGPAPAPMQRMNTKSSSSSDSLQHQHLHKFNTMARLEATNVLVGDPFYGGGAMHPLMYAASRPIGGSQILVDPYDQPQMYKSDSRASILSEYSLRSSDNSHHRYHARYNRYGGRVPGEISDSSLGDSLFSYNSAQRRYFGSSESCRFAFECRRCSLDGGGGGVSGAAAMGNGGAGNDKCSYSDTCRYECRNCDCSSSYFSSDFDTDMYGSVAGGFGPRGSGGIPRKTAAGTLPSSSMPPPQADYERTQDAQMDLKQNKYAQDFFKHVNDVKRSIYQSEMQRNSSSMDAPKSSVNFNEVRSGSFERKCDNGSPQRAVPGPKHPAVSMPATLPLTKERSRASESRTDSTSVTPTPAPRTSLQQAPPSKSSTKSSGISAITTLPQPSERRREYPSLDRLVATATGAIPKTSTTNAALALVSNNNNSGKATSATATIKQIVAASNNNNNNNNESQHQSPKKNRQAERIRDVGQEEAKSKTASQPRTRSNPSANMALEEAAKQERYLSVTAPTATAETASSGISNKRHHRSTSSSKSLGSATRRSKDTPAPPPPSPATYADLQELKANMECGASDKKDASSAGDADARKQKTRKQKEGAGATMAEQPVIASVAAVVVGKQATTRAEQEAKPSKRATMAAAARERRGEQHEGLQRRAAEAIVVFEQSVVDCGNTMLQQQAETTGKIEATGNIVAAVTLEVDKASTNGCSNAAPANSSSHSTTTTATASTHIDTNDEDDVFYDARSEDSGGGTFTSALSVSLVSAMNNALQQAAERRRHKDVHNNLDAGPADGEANGKQQPQQQQQIASKSKSSSNRSERSEEKLHAAKDNTAKLKDTHVDVGGGGVGAGGSSTTNTADGGERSKRKSKKDNSETVTSDKRNEARKTAADGAQSALASASAAATPTAPATVMALNLDKAEATAAATTPTTPNIDQKGSKEATGPTTATASVTKVRKHRSNSKHRQQHKSSSTPTTPAPATTLTISCATCCQLCECEQPKKSKSKTSGGGSSKERATKIKQESTRATSRESTTPTPAPATPCADAKPATTTATLGAAPQATVQEIGAQSGATQEAAAEAEKAKQQQGELATANVAATNVAGGEKAYETSSPAAAAAEAEPAAAEPVLVTAEAEATSTTPTYVTATAATPASLEPVVAASATNAAVSCDSDIAGVATLANSVSSTVPIITTTQTQATFAAPLADAPAVKRPPLYRQDYSCLDSSEAQSDDSHLTRDSVTRESQNDELSSSTHDKIDVSTLPLPALPPKKRRSSRTRASPSRHHSHSRATRHESDLPGEADANAATGAVNASEAAPAAQPHLSAFQQYVAKRRESLEASTRSFNEKLEARRMHYHMGGGGGGTGGATGHMPTYLFGEHYYGLPTAGGRKGAAAPSKEEIFLNKSGWVQVNTKRGNDENRGAYRRANYAPHQNGDLRNTIRVIQIDNTRRSDLARQALMQQQHSLNDSKKFASSKVEELIARNEDRLNNGVAANPRDPTLRPGYRIVDPQLASILNERPGFLPVKNRNDADSPPPITPILSPPPAFQDSSKSKHFDRRKTIGSRPSAQQSLPTSQTLHASNGGAGGGGGGKGMVFSRSFEYDMRRPAPPDTYVETFSRSFDGNLSERPQRAPMQRERSPNFSTLTGNSPNYLTKKDSGGGSSGSLRSRDNSPKYQQPQTTAYLNTSVKEAPPSYSVASASKHSPRARHERSFERSKSHNLLGRSRKSQFNRVGSSGPLGGGPSAPTNVGMSRFRSFDTSISQRLNSCDSGARSDLSNDELDNEDDDGSTEFLTTNYHQSISPLKTQRQRSLTPDRNESQSSSSSMRKQRSLTPESRSLTPEDRRKKGSQASLMGSRQNSGSRSNTLERKQRLDEAKSISRSSSSSSYSGREHDAHVAGGGGSHTSTAAPHMGNPGVGSRSQHRRSLGRNAKQTEEHRIRRSRSLQLSERSPNRSHKLIVPVGQSNNATANQQPAMYQQGNYRSNGGGHSNYAPSMRTGGKSQSLLVNNSVDGRSNGGRSRNNDIDKSRSFDFDYCNYNNGASAGVAPKNHSGGGGGGNSSSNQNVPMRLDFDKSRSFDDDYREPHNSNNNLGGANGSMRYLQTNEGSSSSGGAATRLRRSSPAGSGGAERNSRSPQSSGSSCNNLNLPRQSTSPQNYGTRLCDHELTYDMLRKSLDRSPIMDFRRGDSSDYDLPVMRNRETINSGGNSELNFLSSDGRIYEHPTTVPPATTSSATSTLKQQRSLGHAQSPSESQYSLERMHSSRDSLTPDEMDYRADYIYRQPQQHRDTRRENRGSQQLTPSTSRKPKATAAPMTKTKQAAQVTSCSFWPHCGACNKKTLANPDSASAKLPSAARKTPQPCAIKRQSSLQTSNSNSTPTKYDNVRPRANDKPLRRNHSAHGAVARNKSAATDASNVSTVSVNVNVIKLANNALLADVVDTDKSHQRSKSQWTLLCSGAAPAQATLSASVSSSSPAKASTRVRLHKNHSLTADVETSRPRVTPLAATSLVFLGDCEMPITRDRDFYYERAKKSDDYGYVRMQESTTEDGCEEPKRNFARQQQHTQMATTANKINDGKRPITTTATATNTTNMATSTTTRKDAIKEGLLRRKERSLSLPNILQQQHRTSGLSKTTTTNDCINVIGIRNGFATNLSQQIRAVSSPSLTDAILQESSANIPTPTLLHLTSATSSTSDDSTAHGNSSNSTHLSTSQSVGVLQKFKRTLTNFNKNPQHYASQSASVNNGAAAANSQYVRPASVAASLAPDMLQENATSDATAPGIYRFGPLIWRSSKERRKTKYNRRDKCNSGDSGIQIELENDEQFARALTGGNAASTSLAACNIDEQSSPKLRAVRRTNSAKATGISDQSSMAAMSAKAKILKKMEICSEREAPESLPTRSLSQPNGLETFGIGRGGDLDDSDSDSVTSHDEGPSYYPVYAEVLYNFTAAGPQELGLERGTLIEVLRKEVGPWWFGRIKREDATLVEEILDPELGWFPKEFVRIIQCPETDAFFLSQITQAQQAVQVLPARATAAAAALMSMETPAVSAPKPPTSLTIADSSSEMKAQASEAPAEASTDQTNVTTIIIESPSYNSTSSNSDANALIPSRSLNIMDGADVMRRSAVKELLDTEVNYVKLLHAICEGYLPAMSKRIDIFSPNSIRLIFSNISAIYKFQRKFLEALRKGIEQNQIAKVFLKMHKGFLCYSTYCNAYPRALIELESYDRIKDAKTILDNCRESENLAELPLSAHLLAPVQRICRYPLHLNEIIKNATKSADSGVPSDLQQLEQLDVSQLDIPDTRETIDMALEAMKGITEAVNEGKRHSETIARHQASFQNFKGPPLHLHSTRFFVQIDATRQKQNLWNSSCTLFLFDNQLIYCKRDIIKRSHFIYKGRIFLDRCRVVNVRDGKMFGHTIKNSLRIYCEARDKWFDFSFRSANRKHRFLNTLALERQFGGKALYVAEMTGFEYAYEERGDYSDQSDYEMPDSENALGGLPATSLRLREHSYDVTTSNGTSVSGDSSVPESPVKYKYTACDTLPKKSQSRDAIAATTSTSSECQTGSLGRRRLGNWFRKPKSANATPNHSPTHKPTIELLQMGPESTTLVERHSTQDISSSSTS